MAQLHSPGWLGAVVLGLLVAAVTAAVLHARRPTLGSMGWAVGLVLVTFFAGLGATVVGLSRAFGAVAAVEPSQKASRLAQGISEAMNCTAFGLGAVVLWTPPFVIGEVRRRRVRRPEALREGERAG